MAKKTEKTSRTSSVGSAGSANNNAENEIFATNRSCRDIFCSILFVGYLGGCIYLAIYAYQKDADPRRLVFGYDKFGNTCGRKNSKITGATYSGLDTSKFLYHYSEQNFDICVRECPNQALNTDDDLKNLFNNENIKMCVYNKDVNTYTFDSGTLCAKQGSQPTHAFLFDCVSVPVGASVTAQLALAKVFVQKLAADLYVLWKIIVISTLLAIPLCFLSICLLNTFAPFFIYVAIGGIFFGSLGSTTFMWLAYNGQIYIREAAETHRDWWLAGSITTSIVTAVLCLIILAMLKRVKIAIAMFDEAQKFIRTVPFITCQPMFSVLYFLLSAFLISLLMLALMTPHSPEVNSNGIDVTFKTDNSYYLWLIAAFLLFWVYQIAHDSTEFVIASSVSRWYFTSDKSNMSSVILTSIVQLFRYHFGSILFGSLIIAIIKFIRAIIYYISQKLDQAKMNFVKCCFNCIQCFLACFEKTIKFLTRNAYIEMSISGKGFIPSARKSFTFMVRHALSLATINVITFVILWFAKLCVALGVSAIAFYAQQFTKSGDEFNYTFSAALISGAFSVVIAHMFMEVFDMTIDTIFYCFCKDKDINKGKTAKSYYMSKDLMRLVHVRKHSIKDS